MNRSSRTAPALLAAATALALVVAFAAAPPRVISVARADEALVPTTSAELFAWLQAGKYKEFPGETAVHPSDGPHGKVRSYVNPILETSLKEKKESHPVNAASIKELYNNSDRLIGWAVSVKVQEESADGDGWYWYENFSTTNNRPIADGKGVGLCTGCHSVGTDYIRLPYPLK